MKAILFVALILSFAHANKNMCSSVVNTACENYEELNLLDKLQCIVDKEYKVGEICVKDSLSQMFTQTYEDPCSKDFIQQCVDNGKSSPKDVEDAVKLLDCFGEKKSIDPTCKLDREVAHHHHPCPPFDPNHPYPPHHHHHHHGDDHDGHHQHDHHDDEDGDDDDDDDDEKKDKSKEKLRFRPAPWRMWDSVFGKKPSNKELHHHDMMHPIMPTNKQQQNIMNPSAPQENGVSSLMLYPSSDMMDKEQMHAMLMKNADDPNAISPWKFMCMIAQYQQTGVRPSCKLPWEENVDLPVCVFRAPHRHHFLKIIAGILAFLVLTKLFLRFRRGGKRCCKQEQGQEVTVQPAVLYEPLKNDAADVKV